MLYIKTNNITSIYKGISLVKMSGATNNKYHYDAYYSWEEKKYESVNTNDGVVDNKDEHAYDYEDVGEYVLEQKDRKNESKFGNQRPEHRPSVPQIYDDLDYNLSPRNETIDNNQTIDNDFDKENRCSKQKKIVIASLITIILIGAVGVGVNFAIQCKF